MSNLAPCPFCGSTETLYFCSNGTESVYVACGCGADGPAGESDAEACDLWNTRADAGRAP